ncbi:hypothetical protein D3C73_911720 [compost metagenome]
MITIISVLLSPASFNASNAIPPVRAPSPITATTLFFLPKTSLALAIPNAAEIEVEECPVSKESYILSPLLGKPLSPSKVLNLSNFSFLPVKILCT